MEQMQNGGVQYVPQIAVQYIYLDFDGELTSYNGEILSLEHVEVRDSLLTADRIADIVAELNTKYADSNVIFVTERPTNAEYSTIYIGKTDAFNPYGSFTGLAETIDKGNTNTSDNAFVMLDASATNLEILNTISHEADHLLGTLDHGGSGLAAYAANITVSAGTTSTGLTVSAWNSMTVWGTANRTTVESRGYMYISSGGVANNTTVNPYGDMYISSGGVANSTTVNSLGLMYISYGGVANSVTVNSGGVYIKYGGVANSTIVNSRGDMYISSGGVANSITVNSGGYICISYGGVANSVTVNSDGYISIRDGVANSTTVNSWGSMYISSGGVASSTTVNWNGHMEIFSGGVANSTTVNSYGYMEISCGGVADSTTVNSSGCICISSGGVANSTPLSGYLHISSGGVANSTIVDNCGKMYIDCYGEATNTTVNSGGYLYISSGGMSTEIKENGGWVSVADGATVSFVSNTISSFSLYGCMTVHSNTVADSITVNSCGSMHISDGGTATNILVSRGGWLGITVAPDTYIQGMSNGSAFEMKNARISGYNITWGDMIITYGGVANETIVSGFRAAMTISSGGVANNTTVNSGGGMYISSGGVANCTTINSGGYIKLSSGGVASGTILNSSGYMIVFRCGAANNTFVNSSSCMTVSCGGTATCTTVNSYGSMTISSGGNANSTTVKNGGTMYIESGGSASIVFAPWQGNIYSESGATVEYLERDANVYIGGTESGLVSKCNSCSDFVVSSGLSAIVYSGGTAKCPTVNFGGSMLISSGGVATSTTVNSYGAMTISSGGVAISTTVNSYGAMTISSGGVATTINVYDRLYISSGGTATEIIENGGCVEVEDGANVTFASNTINALELSARTMTIHSNTVANGLTLNDYAWMYISSGGVATSTTLNAHGGVCVYRGGFVSSTTVNSCGWIDIYSGGTAIEIIENGGCVNVEDGANVTFASNTINALELSDCAMTIHSNTVANGLTLNDYAWMYISSGGVATSTTLNAYGGVHIFDGGSASNTNINSDGLMYISSGGMHRGSLQIANGAKVSVNEGGIIDFTLVDRSAKDSYLINDLSLISGAPAYTITVSAKPVNGIYKLAQGTANFSGTVSIGTDGGNYGTLSVNGPALKYNDVTYSIIQTSGDLTLTISGAPIELSGNKNGVSFTGLPGDAHIVEFSKGNFSKILSLEVSGDAVDTYNLPAGTYLWQVCTDGVCHQGDDIVSNNAATPQNWRSDADGNTDLFFGNANSVWESGYAAEHQGVLNGWNGTAEQVVLDGKNKVADVFTGSSDANILVLTDDANGDALFVDDVFTAFGKDAARLSQIDEIRAGYGDDIVDMTSQQFAYSGDGVTIYGGAGDDVIWANNGSNTLYGDAGNDRIIGGSGNDVIVGGSGNDRLHGGGGADSFCFGGNWGNDTVEQLDGSSVTLWFESGSESNWNADTLTYTDGANTVTVSGVSNVTLKFGTDASLLDGAFDDFASEKIFEDKSKGMIA